MSITEFPQFRDVNLTFLDIIKDFLTRSPREASEYTFTNIFAFRFKLVYNFKVSLLKSNLILLKDTEPVAVFCPVGDTQVPDTLSEIFDYLGNYSDSPYLERVPESFANAYLKDDENYILEEDRDQFDYIYNVRELIQLKGNKFHDKKNKVNKFRKLYTYEYLPLTHGLIEECLAFEDYWCKVRACEEHPGLKKEQCAILQMLKNFRILNLKGGAIRVGGKIAALTLGEKFLNDTFVIHVEKANPDISGLYQVINQEFLMYEAGDCIFVNWEQDLGEPGLRKAKTSYNPVRFIKKYKVRRRIK